MAVGATFQVAMQPNGLHCNMLTISNLCGGRIMDDPAPHGRCLRTGRFSQPQGCYLVTVATHQRTPLFQEFAAGRLVVNTLHHQHHTGIVNSLAFVVMPDHLHWLVQIRERHSLSRILQFTKAMSARRINVLRDGAGMPVWQSGFHDHAVREEEDLRDLARYVITNPLRAGLVTAIGDYPLWDAAWL
jgi:REP element-mobilizing transposase RayT